MFGYGSGLPFLFPFLDVLVIEAVIEGSVGNKPVLIGEGESILIVEISAGEAQVAEFRLGDSVGVNIGINTRNSTFVGSV